MVLAILRFSRSPTRSLLAYMVAMLSMIWGLGAWAAGSNRLTSPREMAVKPNQLRRKNSVEGLLLIFLPDEGEQPGLQDGTEDVGPPAVI